MSELAPFHHISVLLREILQFATNHQPQLIVDCTLGGAGHAAALLEKLPNAHLIGIDQDVRALQEAESKLSVFERRFTLIHDSFENIETVIQSIAPEGVDFILADLGVSSHQLDTPERGFSFRFDGPLDMRMNTTQGPTAAELLRELSVDAFAKALKEFADERYAYRIAQKVLEQQPQTTLQLAHIVRNIVPKSADGIDPATRTFQALRILVNGEARALEKWLEAQPKILRDHGLSLAISFHSLEDRLVKHAYRREALACWCPPRLPVCQCAHVPTMRVLTKHAIEAQQDERHENPRSRSAKLRVAQRLPRT